MEIKNLGQASNSDQINNLALGIPLPFNVDLRGCERRMSCQMLYVTEAASDATDFASSPRDEGSPSAVAGATVEAKPAV